MLLKKIFKKTIAIILIMLLSVNSFAAVVSDNDGSAFITKAEFDSLKNNFQAQIDEYNTSIDNKIDGAIAAYLAGIRVSKKTEVPIVVSNYNDMIWLRKLYVYGSYADYTSKANRTLQQNIWYEPKFQKGIPQRNPTSIANVFALSRFNGCNIISMYYKYNISGSSSVAMWQTDFAQTHGAPLPLYLNCKYTEGDDEDIVISGTAPLKLLQCYDSYNGVNMKVGGGMGWLYNRSTRTWTDSSFLREPVTLVVEGDTTFPNVIEILEPQTEDTVINFNVYANRTNRNEYYRTGGNWTLSEFNPTLVNSNSPNDSKAQNQIDTAWSSTSDWQVSPGSFSLNGGHLYGQVFSSSQNEKIPYIVAGDDWDINANILRLSELKAGRTNQRKTTYAEWVTIPVTITSVQLASLYTWTADETTRGGRNVSVDVNNFRLPYLERYPLKNITSGLFKNGQANIKIGEGLPISTYLNGNGILTISFDYTIGRTAETVSSTEDKRIKIDVKKSNFLSTTNDYYTGIVDNATAAIKLQNAVAGSDSSQKAKIVIENVKEGDAVWLRIAPYSTTAGLYAQMSNLSAAVESE